tara:strand:- start:465 stop:1163 length:699 start_codon:yes stop_codon:yes gene_type:complete
MALTKFAHGNTPFNNLNQWIAVLRGEDGGYAVPNRFEVIIAYPPKMGGGYRRWGTAHDVRSISLRCESVNLPGVNLNTLTDSNIYGPTREIVDGVTYAEDITMVFVANAGLEERVFFEEWQKMAFDPVTWDIGYYHDYVSDIDLYLLDRQDQRRFGLKFREAFPKTIAATDLSQSSNNEIIKTSVSFAFRFWETLDEDRSIPQGSDKQFDYDSFRAELDLSANMPASAKLGN